MFREFGSRGNIYNDRKKIIIGKVKIRVLKSSNVKWKRKMSKAKRSNCPV